MSDPVLEEGAEGDAVEELQELLDELGFDVGEVDGQFGPRTRGAVVGFQSEWGFPEDGIVTQEIWDSMRSLLSDEDGDEGPDYPELYRGATGEAVVQLQDLIKNAGYDCGASDGQFGPRTEQAVKDCQTANGFNPNGVVGAELWVLLLEGNPSGPGGEGTGGAGGAGGGAGESVADPVVKFGDSGEAVVEIQRLLMLNNFPVEPPEDGNFGTVTTQAVEDLQVAYGLDPTGQVNAETWYVLRAGAGQLPEPAAGDAGATAGGGSTLGSMPELKNGDDGDQVSQLQELLKAAGHDPGPIDGDFGPRTEAAVRAFQSAHGLEETGTATQPTWDALAEAGGGGGPTPLTEPLQRGDNGEQVRRLQQLLQSNGCDPGPIDGDFGPRTESAVKTFQQQQNLPSDGVVNEDTWAALTGQSAEEAPPEPAAEEVVEEETEEETLPTLRRGEQGYYVQQFQLLLYNAGWNPGRDDGVFDEATQNVLLEFQTAYGLPASGMVTPDVWDELLRVTAG